MTSLLTSQPPNDQGDILSGRYRTPARALYLAAAILSLGWFVINLPFAFQQVQRAGAMAMAQIGAPTLYTLYTVGLDTLFVALCTAVSLTIFRHKSNEGMALLTAGTLVVWGVFNGLITQSNQALGAPEGMDGLPGVLGGALVFAGYMGWMLFFYLFPSGHFVPGWTRLTALAWLLFSGSWILWPDSPLTPDQWPPWLFIPVVLSLWASFAIAQIIRYRRVSSPAQKMQTKWVVYGVSVVAAGFIPSVLLLGTVFEVPLTDVGRHMLTQLLSIGFISLIPLTIGIAILRHRLWDIDLLINRTLVYGGLTAITMTFYVLLVGGAGALFQSQARGLAAFLATGAVAVLFQPLRVRLQRTVDRLMYGQRDDPVGMLTHLAQRLETADSPERILSTLVETIATALKLPYVALWLPESESQWQPVAVYGRQADDQLMIPLLHQNREIGRLAVSPRGPGERFSREDERLLAAIAQLSATTVQAARLSQELQQSRRQIVASREEERRRLRRDLHDGLGPVLASVALQADTARDLTDSDPAETKAILNSIMDQAQAAVTDVRRLVYNLRPPALDELGLAGALRQAAQAYQHQVRIHFDVPDLPPLPAAVEVAAYRCGVEALNNVARHAQARNCTVTIRVNDGLRLVIEDDGVGLPETIVSGVGLISMQERAAELGGTCTVARSPAGGARVTVLLPMSPEESNPGENKPEGGD